MDVVVKVTQNNGLLCGVGVVVLLLLLCACFLFTSQ